MFQFLFKYSSTVFRKGQLVLLAKWPAWLLAVTIAVAALGLGVLTYGKLRQTATKVRSWQGWMIWAMQSAFLALVLFLLWQPAMVVNELNSQQNIIAVVVDDSRSMNIADSGGRTREAAAVGELADGLLAGLQQRFQTRIYRLGGVLTRVNELKDIRPEEPATRIGNNLKQLATETSDLPVGAIVLLSDGGENTTATAGLGITRDALQALRNRHIPVHTLGFGRVESARDLEIEDVSVAPSVLVNSRVPAAVKLTQRGYAGQKAKLTVRDGAKSIAEREISLASDGQIQTETFFFPAGAAGPKSLTYSIAPLQGEENLANNAMTRPISVSDTQRRILYVEGEPRWEYKFIRRAEGEDPTIQLVSMLRTSENKIYRQGISDPGELANGFPVRAEDLFGYSGIVIGSVDANYFTPLQQELLREYVDDRGGGILFLGGRFSLSDGDWGASRLNDLLPTVLPPGNHNFHRSAATVELTSEGLDSPITQLLDDPTKNAQRWKKLTYLADYEDPGTPKPGASVLADLYVGRRKLPLLITESYGHGRTAILATGGTWRWQMSEALGDASHHLFWQQLLRWLVAESRGPVVASLRKRLLIDEGRVELTVQVRDKQFHQASNTRVTAHIVGPAGVDASFDLTPSTNTPGLFEAEWTAEKPGTYLAEVKAESTGDQTQGLGRDVVTFQREDGVAENFHTEQNRALLEKLAADTGGRYWKPSESKDLPRDVSYSEAGISVSNTKELWDAPIAFVLLLALPTAEWLLRRRWGVI
jgi:uncharacterized membrane protein